MWILSLFSIHLIQAGLLVPEDSANLNYIHIAFEWEQEGDAVDYHLQVALENDPDFENPVIDLTDPTLISIITENLNWETSYLWRVRPVYTDETTGSWIDTYSFTILSYINIPISTVIYDSENKEVGSNKDKLLTFLLIAAVLVIWYVFR